MAAALACEVVTTPSASQVHSPICRLGAFVDEMLVGWTYGWMERSHVFYVANSGVIAKLQAGFHVSGLSQSAQMGTLVEMTLHLFQKRHKLFQSRSIPYVTPDACPL